jgi:hypothetical protein
MPTTPLPSHPAQAHPHLPFPANLLPPLFALTMLAAHPGTALSNEIIIDNTPFNTLNAPIAQPVIAIRPIADISPVVAANLSDFHISKTLIINSAKQFPEITDTAAALGYDLDSVTFDQLREVIDRSGYRNKYLYRPGQFTTYSSNVVTSDISSDWRYWDATTITNFVSTGVINTSDVTLRRYGDKNIETVRLNKDYAPILSHLYEYLGMARSQPIPNVAPWLVSLQDDVRQYTPLQESLLQSIGEITFGIPIVYSASEKGLAIPESLRKKYDVYWVDFAVTFRGMNPKGLAEMVVNYALPEGSVAIEIVPLEYGVDESHQESVNAPDVGIDYGGAKITVGEFFKTTVSYKYLRPTVIGYGLGQRTFSWQLEDEAIRSGSHRFAAIIGVPKNTHEVDIAMSGHVRLRQSFAGEILGGEAIGGTRPFLVPVTF